LLKNMTTALDTRLPAWKDKTIKILSDYIDTEDLEALENVNTSTWEEDRKACLELLNELKIIIDENPKEIIEEVLPKNPRKGKLTKSNKVFVIHGHDALARTEVARTLEKLELDAIVLHEQPNEGKTVIEKFERDASQVSFAVAILTPDDTGYPINKPDEAKSRARQNVILELGYFSGILGRSNVAVLYKGDVEIPSDYLGVVYIHMDNGGAWQYTLSKELKTAGLNIDLNKLL
ncbi:MAG: nucleotide-binding protein, partial [Flavobacterium sp.]|nr:nucleotide-binding protein [Flavobacterium sp.]